jgi:FKBP-type peptidyl-prolyl cis-trans isomerase
MHNSAVQRVPQSHTTEYLHRKHMNAAMSEEERAAQRAKEAAGKKLYRQRKNAAMSEEERAAQRAKVAARAKLNRQRKNAAMSEEERAAQRAKMATATRRCRQRKDATTGATTTTTASDYEIPVDITGPATLTTQHCTSPKKTFKQKTRWHSTESMPR